MGLIVSTATTFVLIVVLAVNTVHVDFNPCTDLFMAQYVSKLTTSRFRYLPQDAVFQIQRTWGRHPPEGVPKNMFISEQKKHLIRD